ncbi:MAG: hypothetical protein C4576_00200 [Desulfobacteraceae bacterium]|nr:MAG: hypothetical protein C4576_00200 [Desulfobacteraceae bacterium]
MPPSVAIVVPIYQEHLSSDEQLSLRHLLHFLSDYDLYSMVPRGRPVFDILAKKALFQPEAFINRDSYSHLLVSPEFYETFESYEYILIYQLDCLVFSDQLAYWCAKGYDYIGAPLFRDKADPGKGLSRTGNGGFSLRKTSAFLRVLSSPTTNRGVTALFRQLSTGSLQDLEHLPAPARLMKTLSVLRELRRGVKWYADHYTLNEDLFWSDRAKLFWPDFQVAPVEESLKFAFERHPRYCFHLAGGHMPFGCHAWAKYERSFWSPHLLND